MKFQPATTLRAAESSRHYLANVTYSSTIGIFFNRMTINGDLVSASCQERMFVALLDKYTALFALIIKS